MGKRAKETHMHRQTDSQPLVCILQDVIVCTLSKIALHYTRQNCIATQTLNAIPNIDLVAISGQGGLFIVFIDPL
jgi:hypothetical protein